MTTSTPSWYRSVRSPPGSPRAGRCNDHCVTDALQRSPLDAVHRAAGARMVPFGGWERPLEYPTGTIAEHLACRRAAVVFDVSHLGTVRVSGPDARERLQWAFCN